MPSWSSWGKILVMEEELECIWKHRKKTNNTGSLLRQDPESFISLCQTAKCWATRLVFLLHNLYEDSWTEIKIKQFLTQEVGKCQPDQRLQLHVLPRFALLLCQTPWPKATCQAKGLFTSQFTVYHQETPWQKPKVGAWKRPVEELFSLAFS